MSKTGTEEPANSAIYLLLRVHLELVGPQLENTPLAFSSQQEVGCLRTRGDQAMSMIQELKREELKLQERLQYSDLPDVVRREFHMGLRTLESDSRAHQAVLYWVSRNFLLSIWRKAVPSATAQEDTPASLLSVSSSSNE